MGASHDHHDDDGSAHAHDFDGEPVQELAAGEPRTPSWVPMLGLGLFLVAGIYGLRAMGSGEAAGAAPGASASASAAVAPPPPAAAPRGEAVQIDPRGARAAGSAAPMDPEKLKELQDRLLKMRDEGKLLPAPPAQPPAGGPPAGQGH